VNLHNQRNSIQAPLVLRQQCQRQILLASPGQNSTTQQLHRQIISLLFGEFLRFGHGRIVVGALFAGECCVDAERGEVGAAARFWGWDGGEDLGGLAEFDLRAVLQDLDGEAVAFWEVGGGVVGEDELVLALDEGCVDVDELAVGAEGVHVLWCICFFFLVPWVGILARNSDCSSPWFVLMVLL
jgi:hypothetical protein